MRVEVFAASLPLADYVRDYRDEAYFSQFCRKCEAYGRSWACPPFEQGSTVLLGGYQTATLTASKIQIVEGSPISKVQDLIRPERKRVERLLLDMEQCFGGRSFAYAGTCLYCPMGTCTRMSGQPCRHPDLVRPSLEAVGFDIGKTTSRLLGIELRWGKDGIAPEYITLVSGFFHNSDAAQVEYWISKSTPPEYRREDE